MNAGFSGAEFVGQGMTPPLSIESMDASWEEMLLREQARDEGPRRDLVLPPLLYARTLRRVRAGEDVRLPLSGWQFYDLNGTLALRLPAGPRR
jgi:hypothetical protein